jgi:ABC-type transport system involved in multi-copper enzyme maturation permease subunit
MKSLIAFLITLVLYFVIFLLTYGICYFISNEPDPFKWHFLGKTLVVFLGLVCLGSFVETFDETYNILWNEKN